MSERPLTNTLPRLSQWITAKMGLCLPPGRWDDLERKATAAANELGFANLDAFAAWLYASPISPEQVEIPAGHLTIAETYYWREPKVFQALTAHILPDLIQERRNGERRLRIWSAGCATGEEPYSLAIALCRVLPAIADWHISILATDINPRVLRHAQTGIQREWAFRNAPPWLKDGYFVRRDRGLWELDLRIRKMVAFAYLNLAEDPYP